MRNTSKMHSIIYVSTLLCLLCTACKNNQIIDEQNTETPGSPSTPIQNPTSVVPDDATIYTLGTGSGNLTIDGKSLKITGNALIKVKAGNYTTITIKNILAPADKPVFIKNDGEVKLKSALYTDNITNVTIAGDNVAGLQYGFKFEDISYRAISMSGKMNGVTIKNMSFKNVENYVISGENNNGTGLKYAGTADSRTENFKIINCLFDNAGSIVFGGSLNKDTGEDSGLYKDVEVAYNTFQNTNAGSVCSFLNVQDYNIHHNIVNNINQKNETHNGVFFMEGNGKFHDNKLTNYQGNSIRMWPYSRGSAPVTVEIYNNICYNTRKYGAFELQEFENNLVPGKSTYANAKVYNNTAGMMNTSKDWNGLMLDLYNLSGTLEYYNNLGFNLFDPSNKPILNMINNMGDTKIIKETNNKYTSQEDAVYDTNTFTSKFSGIGAPGQ